MYTVHVYTSHGTLSYTMDNAEPIIIIFGGSDKCQARLISGLTFVEYGLTLWRGAIISQITNTCIYVTGQVDHMDIKFLVNN